MSRLSRRDIRLLTTPWGRSKAQSLSSTEESLPLMKTRNATTTEMSMNFDIVDAGTLLRDQCYQASYSAGWWTDKDGRDSRENPFAFSNKLMLIVSEIVEAMEADRKSLMDDK